MKIDTKFWVLNSKQGPITLNRLVGSETIVLNDLGQIGHNTSGRVEWYLSGKKVRLAETQEQHPTNVTLPRISLTGDNYTVIEYLEHASKKFIGFAQNFRSQGNIFGTLHLIDLWMHMEEGIRIVDLALAFSFADLDFSACVQVPNYLGWTGITRCDGEPPGPLKVNRYKRAPVI